VDVVIQSDSFVEDVSARLLDLHTANRRPSHRAGQTLDRTRSEAEMHLSLERTRSEVEPSLPTPKEDSSQQMKGGQAEALVNSLPGLTRSNKKWDSPLSPQRAVPPPAMQPPALSLAPELEAQPPTPMNPGEPTAVSTAEPTPAGGPHAKGARVDASAGPAAPLLAPPAPSILPLAFLTPLAPLAPPARCSSSPAPSAAPVAPSADAAPRTLRVCALDDESIPRMIQTLFIKHHLHASLEASCALGATEEEMRGFVDVALGNLNPDLSPNLDLHRQADVVLLDENILPPSIMGSQVAGELRARNFTGVTVILTGASASKTEQIRALPAVDLVFDKGHPLPKMAEAVFRVLEQRRRECSHGDASLGLLVH
jgi:hypothetical protein